MLQEHNTTSSTAGSSVCAPDLSERYRDVVFTAAPVERRKTAGSHRHPRTVPDRIAPRVASPRIEPPITAPFALLLERVFELASLPLPAYRLSPLGRRVPACLRALRCRSVEAALATIESHPASLQIALNSILVGVTSFFRDPDVFDYLRRTAIPKLLARRLPIRVWSAACSDGAELYSIAMMLDQAQSLAGADLLGTDCRPAAVQAAERGMYTQDAVQDLHSSIRNDYFEPRGVAWQIRSPLRSITRWHTGDLMNDAPPGRMGWDLVLCRNLAIYLDTSASHRLWQMLAGVLRPGGILVVGKAERPTARGLLRIGPCCYEKQ